MDHTLGSFWGLFWTLMLLHLPLQRVHGFFPNFWSRAMAFAWGSITHQDMTEDAILSVTLRLFMEMPHPKGKHIREEDFKNRTLLADDIFAAFFGPKVSAKRFRGAIAQVTNANAAMDFLNTTRDDPVLHFDSELIHSANAWLLQARKEVLQAVHSEQYGIAREKLGQLLHTLQDFYSHSNWVELGHRHIHPHLLKPGREIKSIAEADIQTCSSCLYWTCEGNLLEGLATKGLLTTGYYGTKPEKPKGKCSHGGKFDDSRYRDPHGGINKDSSSLFFSPHHYLHSEAAALAREASTHFLEVLWQDIGNKQFMRLLDISPATGLSFIVDTTGSMGEEINAAKSQARKIIDSRRGTLQEPDFYLLVPFNDPDFGPLLKTSDPEKFWEFLDTIHPLGGKDEPEMCLSALELALQNSPPYSEIFVFTDASAKDAHLKNSVEALIQEQKCKVTFLITEDPSRTRVKRETLAPDRFNLYMDLAHSSGGQIIFTNNENIRRVAEIIGESSISSVTLFYHQKGATFSMENKKAKRTRRQATKQDVHPFWIDSLVDKVVLTIQGAIWAFTIQDPTGQSTLDFLHYFAVQVDGRHPGLLKMDSSPIEGVPVYLVVMATGLSQPESGSVQLEAVNLAGKTGSLGEMSLQRDANKTDLFVAKLPPSLLGNGSFTVILCGVDSEGRKVERAAPQVATVAGSLLELSRDTPVFPGKPVSVAWKLTNPGLLKQYGLKASSVPRLPVNISSSRIQLGLNQTATGQMALHVPSAAAPGSVITITLRASALHPVGDPTFAHIHLLVMPPPPVHNLSLPFCNASWVNGSCGPSWLHCRTGHWTATLRIWDKAGVRSVQAEGGAVVPHQADGLAESVSYTSDCCSRKAALVVTNQLGEMYRCLVEAPPEVPGKVVGSTVPDIPSSRAAAAITTWWQVLVAFLVPCLAL
ncbi:von Willebrand factor A domain-containing protein 7 isoform X2 [Heteronotia binoei]|uniref:von Willebrand factor A domain-containing protein 7 isoform X2 n=1 Tax=Heteronotia binoei TaxID=13085 RepID=UPI00292E24DE|nr:von Willebrand factor A domain-containing protein 7 isoform X2 [Heteronotia binoei]